jgi:four helix bundle protein
MIEITRLGLKPNLMFLEMKHTRLDIFKVSKEFVINCYKETTNFPTDEKFGLISQIRRAAVSVHLNVAEGCSRKSPSERRRFYEISRGALVEVDTAFDVAISLNYTSKEKLTELGGLLSRNFKCYQK